METKCLWPSFTICRSSRPEVFCRKGALRNFAKFTEKQLRQGLLFNKVADLSRFFIKKETRHRCFPVNFVKFRETPFFAEQPQWLLLHMLRQLLHLLVSPEAFLRRCYIKRRILQKSQNSLETTVLEYLFRIVTGWRVFYRNPQTAASVTDFFLSTNWTLFQGKFF